MLSFHDLFSLVNDNFKIDSFMVRSVILLLFLINYFVFREYYVVHIFTYEKINIEALHV